MKLYTLLTCCIFLTACVTTQQLQGEQQNTLGDATTLSPVEASELVTQGLSQSRLARVDTAMRKYTDTQKLAGTVTLVARNQEIVHLSANGMRNLETNEEMTTDSIFRIYSMTKPITAVAALTLWEQGKFHMYDPIEKYLPELAELKVFAGMDGENMRFEPSDQPVRIIDLFLHTAGFSYGFTNSEVDKLYQALPPVSDNDSVETVLQRISALPLNHQPGTQWHYGINTDIIGFLVERISGMKLGDYMQQIIFDPLQMTDTAFYVPLEKRNRLVQIYGPGENSEIVALDEAPLGDFLSDPSVHNGGGGLVSTISDYYIFAQMLLNGGEYNGQRILGRKTVEYLRSNHLPANLIPFSPTSHGEGHALAMSVTVNNNDALLMGSDGDYGWGGAASTYFRIDPKENMVIIMMSQFVPSAFYPVRHDFKNTVYQSLVD
jgi:CubicO group peptidase (beta-lactamase class C family)